MEEKEVYKIKTLIGNNRMSTQELLQLITTKLDEGYTKFDIEACGQHNIGGSSWAKDRSKRLHFKLKNPGQRAGAMALAGTTIYIEGSAPADVGWLNSGAEIIVDGDCGDTAAHCAAGGRIYVSGSVGARSGALMKHDPKFELPELWVLKNTGSFSFEFMSGGIAVVCGYNCDGLYSVLGSRSCVGMVGGTIYVRGSVEEISDSVDIQELNEEDILFLSSGMEKFLKNIKKDALYTELSKWENWKKIVPMPSDKKQKKVLVSDFRKNSWIENGIFGDFINDDFIVYPLPSPAEGRIRIPKWDKKNCVDCKICLNNCPQTAIVENSKIYTAYDEKCIGCGICEAVCPMHCWTMLSNRKEIS